MKQEEKNKLGENYNSIFDAFKQVLADHGLPGLNISAVEFDDVNEHTEQSTVNDNDNDDHDRALFSADFIQCPPGYRKSYRINPRTGEQMVICVPV